MQPSGNVNTFLFFLYFCSFCIVAYSKDVFELSRPSDCQDNEYFDPSSLSCQECEDNLNLQPSADRLQCVCNKYSKMSDFKNGRPVCTICSTNKVATLDSGNCVQCLNGTCQCSSNQIQIDRYANGTVLDTMNCLSCPRNTFPSADRTKCLPCHEYSYKRHDNCVCPIKSHVRIQNYCLLKDDLPNWSNVRNTYMVDFASQSIDSYYLRSELHAAMYLCKKKDKRACEHLSNMCALTIYRNDIPCMLFHQSHTSPTWLFYNKDETTAVLNGKRISETYSLVKDDKNSTLNFTIATFSLDGHLLSVGKPTMPCNIMQKIRFGVNFSKQCKMTIRELLSHRMEFLSPYIAFIKDEKFLVHALPIAIENNNKDTNKLSQWQFVRKFFLVDNISGFKALPGITSEKFKKENELSVLRYMKSLNIVVNVQTGENRGKIFPPLLILEYAELTKKEILEETEVTIEYHTTFQFKDNNIDYNIEIIIGTLSGLAIIFSGFKTWSYYKKTYTSIPSIMLLFWFFVYAMGAVGNVIIFSIIIMCIYLFTFYKGQTVPYILLPNETNESYIRIYTIVAFSFKLIELIGFMYQYWTYDIFLIDWEQPRTLYTEYKYDTPYTSLRKTYSARFFETDGKSSQTPSDIIAAKRKRTPHKSEKKSSPNDLQKSTEENQCDTDFSTICSITRPSSRNDQNYHTHSMPISIWRTYFVANQWLQLQTKRKTSTILQSITMTTLYLIVGMNAWTLAVPELNTSNVTDVKQSFTLHYAICTLLYILIYLIQLLGSLIFYERYVKNRTQEFVDLCSITNISVFILPFNYCGFYIHGRSVHGFADTDLSTLLEDLKKEENNLCAHRGLVPGTAEQTFIISLTETFNTVYKELSKQKDDEINKFLRTNRFIDDNWSQLLDIRGKLTQFLSQFVDHCYKDEDYIIAERHFLERLCDISFISAKEKSIFYIDNDRSFDQVLLYGNEWMLATFELTVFAFLITMYEDCVLSCMVTACASAFIRIIAKYNSRRNLSSRSFLDERFLM